MDADKNLETASKEKVSPLLEETMEKNWGITIPKLESDITDKLKSPSLHFYVSAQATFPQAKKIFRKEFLKRELRLHEGNISHLAKSLSLDRRSIHRAIRELEIDMEQLRRESGEEEQEALVDKVIRSSLEQYKGLIQPHQMEKMYQEIPSLSRNIAKFLPHQELSWKEAETEFEKQFLSQALEGNAWKISQVAEKLKLRPETLHRKIKKMGLRRLQA